MKKEIETLIKKIKNGRIITCQDKIYEIFPPGELEGDGYSLRKRGFNLEEDFVLECASSTEELGISFTSSWYRNTKKVKENIGYPYELWVALGLEKEFEKYDRLDINIIYLTKKKTFTKNKLIEKLIKKIKEVKNI